MLNKTKEKNYYHLCCNYCGKDYIINEPSPKYCPFCGHPPEEKTYFNCAFGQTMITDNNLYACQKKKECSSCKTWTPKDCTTCKHGYYDERYETQFCDGKLSGECKNWDLWEEKRTCYNCEHRVYNMFDGDAFCPIEKKCNNKDKWEAKK